MSVDGRAREAAHSVQRAVDASMAATSIASFERYGARKEAGRRLRAGAAVALILVVGGLLVSRIATDTRVPASPPDRGSFLPGVTVPPQLLGSWSTGEITKGQALAAVRRVNLPEGLPIDGYPLTFTLTLNPDHTYTTVDQDGFPVGHGRYAVYGDILDLLLQDDATGEFTWNARFRFSTDVRTLRLRLTGIVVPESDVPNSVSAAPSTALFAVIYTSSRFHAG
jgi:hypothetical protein